MKPLPYKLEFDAENHRYFVDGKEKPGVSHILKKTGQSKDFSSVDSFYRDRGIVTHEAIKLFLKGDLDESSLDPAIEPYFLGFRKWWHSLPSKKKVLGIEMPLYSPGLGFCGTLDLVLDSGIWDYKCSKDPDPVAELQGEAYKILWAENFRTALPFKVLRLPWEGPKDEIDYQTKSPYLWSAVMELYRWKMKGKSV